MKRLVCIAGFILGTVGVIVACCTLDLTLGIIGAGLMFITISEVVAR